ncbi:MAG TPA: hypothetical protein VIM57_05525 [Luteolibacter sp.]
MESSPRHAPEAGGSSRSRGHEISSSSSSTPLTGAQLEARKAELLAARDTALAIEDPKERGSALSRVCYQWAEFDPLGAIEHALAWQLEDVPGLFENLAHQWASTDLAAARAWTETQPPSEFRSELAARIGFVLAQTDPEAAAHYVIKQTEPGPSQTEAAISVLHQWLKKDPEAAAAWANAFPPGPLRERALQEVEGMRRYQSGDLPDSDR